MPPIPGLRIDRWDGPRAPDQASVRQRLEARGLQPYAWSNGPGFVYAPHRHPYTKHLTVSSGSIRFRLEEYGEDITLAAGDGMVLPPGVVHSAVVGPDGVTCIEAAQRDLG
jgi:quercetin dioxygenase-like cupin family protein